MHYLLKGISVLALFLASLGVLHGALPEHAPISTTFAPNQLQGEAAIWQLAEAPNGQIIVGGEHIGFYSDAHWEFLPEPRKPAIRCLYVDGDTLWVCSLNEIGKFSLPLSRDSHYEKLNFAGAETAGDFWTILRSGKNLIATTAEEAWVIDPTTLSASHTNVAGKSRASVHSLAGRPIIASGASTLYGVVDGKVVPVENPLPDKADTYWLHCDPNYVTTLKAVYKLEGTEFKMVTRFRDSKRLASSALLWEGHVVVVTINQGLVVVDPATSATRFITGATGLPSLFATHAIVDQSGRLWVGTNLGICVLAPGRYGQRIATKDYPLSAIRDNGLLINYANGSDYFYDDGDVEPLPSTYSVLHTSHGLMIGMWDKIRIGEKEFSVPGGNIGKSIELPGGDILTFAGSYFYRVEFASGHVERLFSLKGDASGLVVVDNQLWAASFDGSLLRSSLTPPYVFNKVASFPGASAATLYGLGSTLISATSDQVCFGEQLRPVENTVGIHAPRLTTTANGTLWLVGQQAGVWRLGRLRPQGDGVTWEAVEAKGLPALPEVHFFSASGEALMICGGSSIIELNSAELKPDYRIAAPRLQFTFLDPQTGVTTTQASPPRELDLDKNSVTFTGLLPFDEFSEKPGFERRLLPTETAWVPTRIGEKVSYPSLSSRQYTLEVRATHLGHTGEAVTRTFTVLPPWYLTLTAFGGYVVFAGLLSFSYYRLRTHQIRQRNLELENTVQERTRELAEASAAKTEFLASMSHEIRNPMNGVIGLVNILREQPGLPRQANTLRLLHGCAEQLRSTVDDILDFSKIEARRVGLEISTFDLLDTLEAAAATVDPVGAAISFGEKPPAGISLSGDAAKLRQIFANYLNNALKYGVPPAARVSTILTPVDGDHVRLTVSVTSSGPTIEKDKLDKLFESFTRGDDAIERNIRGTGLGLAICKRYAEAMGGEVGAVSTNGETTFYLNVPFEKAGVAHAVPADAAAAASGPTMPARALAIEDEDYNRIVLGDILTKMNYSVDWATTGAEALQLVQENGYDIVLTDYRLPDTNGVELTKKILQLCPDPKPAVFAVTAYSTRERKAECMAAGMAGFISKPITLEKLRTTIFSWGDQQLTKISLEASIRPFRPTRRTAEIEEGWGELKRVASVDTKKAAADAHRLNNLCRSLHQIDIAEQLELLEGALERGEPTGQLVSAIERLLRA